MDTDIGPLLQQLRSPDPGVRKSAISAALDVLETTETPHPVCDHLFRVGAAVVAPLEQRFATMAPGTRRTSAALLLVSLGSRAGVAHLLEELKKGGEMEIVAANVLSRASVAEAAPLIEARLYHFDLNRDPYGAASLITCLRKLKASFPPELTEHLSRPGLPANVRLALAWKML